MFERMTLRKAGRRIGETTLVILITATLVEVSLRAFYPRDHERPIAQTIPGVKPLVTVSVNALGLRSRTLNTYAKAAGTVRVLCLGASTVLQATQNFEDSWVGRLEAGLQPEARRRGLRLEVAAYGGPGDSMGKTLAWAQRHLPELSPDLIVLLQGVNDMTFSDGPTYQYHPGEPPRLSQAKMIEPPRGWEAPCARSQLCSRIYQVAQIIWLRRELARGRALDTTGLNNLGSLHAGLLRKPFVSRATKGEMAFREFSDRLDGLLRLAKEQHARVLVLSHPTLWKEGMSERERSRLWLPFYTPRGPVHLAPEAMAREMKRYNDRQAELARGNGAGFFPLADEIPRSLDNFIDDTHFNDEGSRLIAEKLLPVVRRELLSLGAPVAAIQ